MKWCLKVWVSGSDVQSGRKKITFFDNFAMIPNILDHSSMNFKYWVVFQSMHFDFSYSTSEASYDAHAK